MYNCLVLSLPSFIMEHHFSPLAYMLELDDLVTCSHYGFSIFIDLSYGFLFVQALLMMLFCIALPRAYLKKESSNSLLGFCLSIDC